MIQKIYVKASDSVKRGLNKSLQECGARQGEVTVYREYKYLVPCLRDVNQGAAVIITSVIKVIDTSTGKRGDGNNYFTPIPSIF